MSLSLKITIVSTGQQKTMRFIADMGVNEAIKEIKEKCNIEGGSDHGLMIPNDNKIGGKWMAEKHTLLYYNLPNMAELLFKKKHSPIKVKLLDETVKTMLVDWSVPVDGIVATIGDKMSIKGVEEFSLQLESKPGEWLHPHTTLNEQSVPDDALLVLKKKFFFSEDKLDKDDPVNLHLVYVQARDMIITGHHPTIRAEARDLAALQMQIVHGSYSPDKFPEAKLKNFVDPLVFMPPSLRKNNKDFDKEIIGEWRKLVSMTDISAKFRYIQLCRSLKTWGITTFAVKMQIQDRKQEKKKKIISTLFGVTRESVVFMEPETKEVTKTWGLTKLRRWAASANSKNITLDFGDYEDAYMILVTDQAEEISSLISGYVDIILKARKAAARMVEEDQEAVAVVENVGTMRGRGAVGSIAQFWSGESPIPGGTLRAGVAGNNASAMKNNRPMAYDLKSSFANMAALSEELGHPVSQRVSSSMSYEQWNNQLMQEMNKCVASSKAMLQVFANPSQIDRTRSDEAAKNLALQAESMIVAARSAAYAGRDPNMDLLNAAKSVADALSNVFACCDQMVGDPNSAIQYRDALKLAQGVFTSGIAYMNSTMKVGYMADGTSQELIMESAKLSQIQITRLLAQAQSALEHVTDPTRKAQLLATVKNLQATGKMLSLTATSLAPACLVPEIKSQLGEAAKTTEYSTNLVIAAAKASGMDPRHLNDLLNAAKDVSDALGLLLSSAECAEAEVKNLPDLTQAGEELKSGLSTIKSSIGDRNATVSATKIIATTAGQIVQAAKLLADLGDPSTRARLLEEARQTAEALQALVNAAKISASNPLDNDAQKALLEAADKLAESCQDVIDDANMITTLAKIRQGSKTAAAATQALVISAKEVNLPDTNNQAALLNAARMATDAIAEMVNSLKTAKADATNEGAQNSLVEVAQRSSAPSMELVVQAKRAHPKIADLSKKSELKSAADRAALALQELMDSCSNLSKSNQDTEEAMSQIDAAMSELEVAAFSVQGGGLMKTGQSKDDALALLTLGMKQLNGGYQSLASAAKKNPKIFGKAAKDVGFAVTDLVQAVQSVAAATTEKSLQTKIIASAKNVTAKTDAYVRAAKAVAGNPSDRKFIDDLLKASQSCASALSDLIAVSRGFDSRVCDEAIDAVLALSAKVIKPTAPMTSDNFQTVSEELAQAVKALHAAVDQLAHMAKTNPKNVGSAAKITSTTTASLVDTAIAAASIAPTPLIQASVLSEARDIIQKIAVLLNHAKATAANKDQSTEASLTSSTKDVVDELENLLRALGAESNRECEEALERIMQLASSLDSYVEPNDDNQRDLTESLALLNAKIKALAVSTSQILSASRQPELLGKASKNAAEGVAEVITTAQETVASEVKNLNVPADILETAKALREDISSVVDGGGDKTKVLTAARKLAQDTANMVQLAKREAAVMDKTQQDSVLKAAQNLSGGTSVLAQTIKSVLQNEPKAKEQQNVAASSLNGLVKELLNAIGGQTNADTKLNPEVVKKLQDAVRRVATGTGSLITAANELTKNNEKNTQNNLSSAGKTVAESISDLIKTCGTLQPGSAEIEDSLENINAAIGDLEAALISVAVGSFEKPTGITKTHQDYQEELVRLAKEIAPQIAELLSSSRLESTENLGKAAKASSASVAKLVQIAKAAVSTTADQNQQNSLLALAKDLADGLLQLTTAAKIAALGQNKDAHKDVATKAKAASDNVGGLVASLKSGVILLREIDDSIKVIEDALYRLDQPLTKPVGTYQNAKDEIADIVKNLGACIKKILAADKGNLILLGEVAKEISTCVTPMVENTREAIGTTTVPTLKAPLMEHAKALADACKKIVQNVKGVASDPKNTNIQGKLSEAIRLATQSMGKLLDVAKQGAVGEKMTDEALAAISKVIADIDAASLFAAAGQLEIEEDKSSMSTAEAQVDVVNTAKGAATAASKLVNSTKGTLEDYAASAKQMATILTKLASSSKNYASLMGSLQTTNQILAAAKAISIAGQQLVTVGKDQQKNSGDPSLQKSIKKGADAIAESIQALIQLTQAAEAEAAKGLADLNTSRSEIARLVREFATLPATPNSLPADIVKAARLLAHASADLATSSGNQEAIASASKLSTGACKQLLETSKGTAHLTGDTTITNGVNEACKNAASAMGTLLDAIKDQATTGLAQQAISTSSTAVADRIMDIITAARKLPGGASLKLEEDTSDGDLEGVASNELANAVKAIEEATALLIAARPPPKSKDSIGFDVSDVTAAIMEACIAIATATQKLVQAAAVAQRERVDKQASNPTVYKKDPMWANGLISAAKNVAGCTQQLVKSANNTVAGTGQEEELVAVARSIAAATAQLVAASRAKADTNSSSHSNLSNAAKAVATATSMLVSAAKQYSAATEEEESSEMATNYTGSAVKQLEAQMKIAKLERELEKARKTMFTQRSAEYKKK